MIDHSFRAARLPASEWLYCIAYQLVMRSKAIWRTLSLFSRKSLILKVLAVWKKQCDFRNLWDQTNVIDKAFAQNL